MTITGSSTPTLRAPRTPLGLRAVLWRCVGGLLALCVLASASDAQVTGLAGRAVQRATAPPALPVAVSWTFDESTTGADIAWTSPTAVDPTAPGYLVKFSLDTIEVSASFLGIPLGAVDVTDQVPPELLQNTGYTPGPTPISLIDLPVVAPPPPDPVALGATLNMGLDASGNAQLLASNIVLGTTVVNVPPFGNVSVNITGFRIAGTVSVTPMKWRILPL